MKIGDIYKFNEKAHIDWKNHYVEIIENQEYYCTVKLLTIPDVDYSCVGKIVNEVTVASLTKVILCPKYLKN